MRKISEFNQYLRFIYEYFQVTCQKKLKLTSLISQASRVSGFLFCRPGKSRLYLDWLEVLRLIESNLNPWKQLSLILRKRTKAEFSCKNFPTSIGFSGKTLKLCVWESEWAEAYSTSPEDGLRIQKQIRLPRSVYFWHQTQVHHAILWSDTEATVDDTHDLANYELIFTLLPHSLISVGIFIIDQKPGNNCVW